MDLEHIGAIFKRVFNTFSLGGELLFLPDRDEAVSQRVSDRRRDDESACFNSKNYINRCGTIMFGQRVDHGLESLGILQQRGDVVEVDAGLRKIRDFPDERFELVHLENSYCNIRCHLQRPRTTQRAAIIFLDTASVPRAVRFGDTSFMSLLGSSKIAAFSATTNAERAKTFYRDQLGLTLVSDEPFALVFDAHGTMLRVQKVK